MNHFLLESILLLLLQLLLVLYIGFATELGTPAGSEGIPIILASRRLKLFVAVTVMVEAVAVGDVFSPLDLCLRCC